MDKPLWKDSKLASFSNGCFYGQIKVVFYIEGHQTLFLGDMYLKRNNKEISNFLTKTMD